MVFRCCIVAIVMFQLLVTGVLGLNRMPTASALMFPLMAFTAYWGNELSRCVPRWRRSVGRSSCSARVGGRGTAGRQAMRGTEVRSHPIPSHFIPTHTHTHNRQFRLVGNTLTLENLLTTDVKEKAPDTMEALKKAYQLHQDDGTGVELSHKAKQPLIEPFAVTRDGQLLDIAEEDEMELGEAEGDVVVDGGEETKAETGESKTTALMQGNGAALDAKTGGVAPVAAGNGKV